MVDKQPYRNKVAIVGTGVAQSLRRAAVPIGSIAIDTADQAIADAGLSRSDIDGVACGSSLPAFGGSGRSMRNGFDFVDTTFLAKHMKLNTSWNYDHASFPPALVVPSKPSRPAPRSVCL